MRTRHIAMATALVMAVSAVSGIPERPAQAATLSLAREPSVPGRSLKVPEPPPGLDEKLALRSTPAVSWPAAGVAEVSLGARPVKAGTLPISVSKRDKAPERVTVEMLPRQQDRLLLRVTRAGVAAASGRVGLEADAAASGQVGLEVDYSSFANACGGDWAVRLRLVSLPECALSTPERTECAATPILTRNNGSGKLSGDVTVPAGQSGGLYAVMAGESSGAGSYAATPLSPSSTWSVGTSSGDFTWQYPMDVPPGLGGPEPQMSLTYSSGNVDGRGSSTNNQPSWVGEGFEFDPGGYIERRYKSCGDDTAGGNNSGRKTGDLCWASDSTTTAPKSAGNAYVVMNGRGGELVRDDTTGTWRSRLDDGSKVELLTGGDNGDNDGEYWRITSRSGTQYYFGKHKLTGWTSTANPVTNSVWTVPVYGNHAGEPCHKSTFDASVCDKQAWRWNLDYVVDPHGNTMSLFYERETNNYGRNNSATKVSTYVRGGYLRQIDYGQRDGEVYTKPAVGRVEFTTAGRCIPGTTCVSTQPANWPDVPWNQACTSTSNCNNKFTPTFWTQNRLKTLTTKVWSGAAYQPVDSWELTHSYPSPQDGTRAGMWLGSIRNKGHVGGELALPAVTFDPVPMHNRVDGNDYIPPMNWMRMRTIRLDSGGELTVDYTSQECSVPSNLPVPDDNTKRCHPVRWTPEGATTDRQDWFNKYVVTQVTETDRTTGLPPSVTQIEYPGSPAWRYDDMDGLVGDKYKTWSQWRGYDRVRVRKGTAGGTRTVTESLFFRGMDGDRTASGGTKRVLTQGIPDSDPLAGTARENVTYTAGDAVWEKETIDPWMSPPTATRSRSWGTTNSYRLEEAKVQQSKSTGIGGWQNLGTEHSYADDGLLTRITDLNDVNNPDDDTCTRYWYAPNQSAWIVDLPYRVQTVTVGCDKTPTYPDHAMVDVRYYYDGSTTLGAVPIRGDVTKVEELSGWRDGTPEYVTTVQGKYDVHGRVTEAVDAKGARTTVGYTPAIGGPLTQVKVTNAVGHTTTTTMEPAWGTERTVEDANRRRTELRYDALGRLVKAWLPGRPLAQSPSIEYGYLVRTDGANAVTTKTLLPDGDYDTSYELYDGLMRPRQTQASSPGGGRLVSDTVYDSRGLLVKENGPYHNDAPPGTDVLIPDEDAMPSQVTTVYDENERPTEMIFRVDGVERWRTTHTYTHNRHDTDPLDGETPTTEIYDPEGRLVELRQYQGSAPTGAYDATRYTYNRRGQLATVTDPAGNVWRYNYDLRGFMVRAEEPDRGVTEYTYNDAGELLTEKDAREVTLAHTYDVLGRRTATHEGSPAGTKRIGWSYDWPVNGKPALGYQTSATRYVDGSEYTVSLSDMDDASGRPTLRRYSIPGREQGLAGTYDFTATYTLDGEVATAGLPAAGGLPKEELTVGYDALGQPATLTGASTYVTGTSYTSFGELGGMTLSAGGKAVKLGYEYEYGTHRLSRAVVKRDTAPQVIADVAYSYDDAGNVKSIADRAPGAAETQCFRYDYLRRATEAWTPGSGDCGAAPAAGALGGPAPYWHSWTFDKTGNRTSETRTNPNGTKTTSAYTYPAPGQSKPHALSKVTTTGPDGIPHAEELGYDAAGNLTTRKKGSSEQRITWDPEGNVESVTRNGGTTSFLYDAGGNRLIRRDASGTTLYLGETELHLTTSGTVTGTRYYTFNGRAVAVRTSADNKLHWLALDHHGTPEIAIDAASQETRRRRYTPYGENRGAAPASWPGQKGFVGGTADPDTGLVHLGAREYDPSLGRFISVDPIVDLADPQQLNSYTYANNNPATYSDPDGQRWVISTRIVRKMKVKMVVEYHWETVWRWVRQTYHVLKKIPILGWIVKTIERSVLISYQVLRTVVKFVVHWVTVAVKFGIWIADKAIKLAARAVAKFKKIRHKQKSGGEPAHKPKRNVPRPKKVRPHPKKSPHVRRDAPRRTNPGPRRNILDDILRGAGRTAVGAAQVAAAAAVAGVVAGATSTVPAAGAGGTGVPASSLRPKKFDDGLGRGYDPNELTYSGPDEPGGGVSKRLFEQPNYFGEDGVEYNTHGPARWPAKRPDSNSNALMRALSNLWRVLVGDGP